MGKLMHGMPKILAVPGGAPPLRGLCVAVRASAWMATASRLVRLVAAILYATPRIGPAEAFAPHSPVSARPLALSKVSCHRLLPAHQAEAAGWRCSAKQAAHEDGVIDGRKQQQESVTGKGSLPPSPTTPSWTATARQNGASLKWDGELTSTV